MPIVGQFGSLAGFGVFPGGAFESIATVTVGSGGASSIEFTSIPGTYQHLQIRLLARFTSTTVVSSAQCRFNSDTTAANYATHYLYGDGASAAAGASTSSGMVLIGTTGGSSWASTFGASVVDILDYTSTSKNKVIRSLSGADVNGAGGYLQMFSGVWINSSSAITSLSIYQGSQTFGQYTTAALYGVRA
jgi:hypothetical protein